MQAVSRTTADLFMAAGSYKDLIKGKSCASEILKFLVNLLKKLNSLMLYIYIYIYGQVCGTTMIMLSWGGGKVLK